MSRKLKLPRGVKSYDPSTGKLVMRLAVPGTNGKQRPIKTITVADAGQIQAEVDAFRQELEKIAVNIENPFKGRVPTLDEYFEAMWDRSLKVGLAPKTQKLHLSQYTNHMKPYVGDRKLTDLNRSCLLDLQNKLKETKTKRGSGTLSPNYINGVLRTLRKFILDAYNRNVIDKVPYQSRGLENGGVRGIPKLKVEDRDRWIDTATYQRFMAVFDDEDAFKAYNVQHSRPGKVAKSKFYSFTRRFGAGWTADGDAMNAYWKRFKGARGIYLVAFHTGLSKGDLLNLRRRDVDLNAGVIHRGRQKTKVMFAVPMTNEVKSELSRRLEVLDGDADTFVFQNDKDRRFSTETFDNYFELACALAGIRDFTPHGMRHCFSTFLLSEGVPAEYVMNMVGHTDVKTTRLYAKIAAAVSPKVKALVEGAFSTKLSTGAEPPATTVKIEPDAEPPYFEVIN